MGPGGVSLNGERTPCRTHRHGLQPSGVPWTIPAITVESAEPGPRAIVCAGLHGDEAIGVGVVQRLLDGLPARLRRGSVRLYPCLNPAGLRAGSRLLPGESLDLNRAFPGDARGSGAQRLARVVWQDMLAFRPQVVLDLHADSPACIPYAILDRLVTRISSPVPLLRRLSDIAKATGLTVIHDYAAAPYRRFDLDRSLSGALLNHGGMAAMTLELGPRRFLEPRSVAEGTAAVLGALDALDLVVSPAPNHPSRVAAGPWRRDPGPATRHSGLLCPCVQPGRVLAPGDILAELRELDGTLLERMVAPHRSLVLSLSERAWVPRGEHVATLAVPDEPRR